MKFTKMHGVGNDFIVFDPSEVEGMYLTGLPGGCATGILESGRTGYSCRLPRK